MNPDPNPTATYRMFDESDRLLYVGITVNPHRRMIHHQSQTPWIGEVITTTIEWHPDERSAHEAEIAAIVAERPKYNVRHHPDVTPPKRGERVRP